MNIEIAGGMMTMKERQSRYTIFVSDAFEYVFTCNIYQPLRGNI